MPNKALQPTPKNGAAELVVRRLHSTASAASVLNTLRQNRASFAHPPSLRCKPGCSLLNSAVYSFRQLMNHFSCRVLQRYLQRHFSQRMRGA